MVIPREDNMVRLYIQIASSTDSDWNPRKTATAEQVQESAKKIFQPYSIQWERVEWYSVYPIGQGLSDRYSLDQRVFIGGDACHTHSVSAIPAHLSHSTNVHVAQSWTGNEHGFSRCAKLGMEVTCRRGWLRRA